MIEKKIEVYADDFIRVDLNNVELACEFNSAYAILVALHVSDKKIIAYEYFEFESTLNGWKNIFNEIRVASKILANKYNTCHLFYNFPEVLVAPALYDNAENSKVFINTFYGNLKNTSIEIDRLSVFDNISVICSVEDDLKQTFQDNFQSVSAHHSYSKLLQSVFQMQQKNEKLLQIFFYNKMFVMILINDFQLQFIKSVNYSSAADVLYSVLNVTKQYLITVEQLQLKISGFVNFDSEEFIILQKYFTHIVIEEPPLTNSLNELFKGFPKQYFTPLFYLLA